MNELIIEATWEHGRKVIHIGDTIRVDFGGHTCTTCRVEKFAEHHNQTVIDVVLLDGSRKFAYICDVII